MASRVPKPSSETIDNSGMAGKPPTGELPSISMRLSGLGFAGEYACTIRCANGFAIGNGRRIGSGVVGVWDSCD